MRISSLLVAAFAAGVIGGCSSASPGDVARPEVDPEVLRHWAQSCALCHVSGTGGAPRFGHAEDWAPRVAQGRQTLLTHTIEGFGNMPPLGYCMACERHDFVALIELMVGGAAMLPEEAPP